MSHVLISLGLVIRLPGITTDEGMGKWQTGTGGARTSPNSLLSEDT